MQNCTSALDFVETELLPKFARQYGFDLSKATVFSTKDEGFRVIFNDRSYVDRNPICERSEHIFGNESLAICVVGGYE